ncbi:substrate-binding domain-containing protein [Microbacterium schleiferi]|uniref:Substrate-binding domain-containing protein n=1 Tax=Microbacterium schleiferi TaxID=69362 RepID=A0A7S8MVX4_9MICO|nr:substrate-binding domain-containing protein [Microbacterium schleiferi]QPE04265.1 substrate-binding domain-containing protein [Microbacterium schleiferi]
MSDVTRPARPAGVREVARLAGVSTQTVSRVINNYPNIRPETRTRVVEAMRALDYRVNNAARALGTASTRTIGVIATDATLYGPTVGIAALAEAAREAGLWIATAYADAGDPAAIDGAIAHVLAQGIDGLVLVAPHARMVSVLRERELGVPVAALHADDGARAQREGAALATAHVVELGHRQIARLGGPVDWLEDAARAQGTAAALDAAGLSVVHQWRGDWSARSGAALAPEVAEAVRVGELTAILAANDQMALGLMAGLAENGIRVPDDLSVVGFDDNPDAAFYAPALTSVRVDVLGDARRCVAEVLGEVASGEASAPAAPPQLMVRASSAPLSR